MIKIFIQGIQDGQHNIDLSVPVSDVEEIQPEFFGEIIIKGKLRKFGKRYTIECTAECDANFICDRSLKEYTERIKAEISVSMLADSFMFRKMKKDDADESDEIYIHEEDKYIDMTEEVREELSVNMPMKRIAPEFADKEIEEIYPEYSAKINNSKSNNNAIDDRWAPLKNLKIN